MSLLVELKNAGQLRTLDHALALSLGRLRPETPPSILVAAALASLAVSQGHAGFDPGQPQRLEKAIVEAMKLKPYRHNFEVNDDVQVVRFMNMTGG